MRITRPRNYEFMTPEEKQKWADEMTIKIKRAREDFHKMIQEKSKQEGKK